MWTLGSACDTWFCHATASPVVGAKPAADVEDGLCPQLLSAGAALRRSAQHDRPQVTPYGPEDGLAAVPKHKGSAHGGRRGEEVDMDVVRHFVKGSFTVSAVGLLVTVVGAGVKFN